MAFVSRNLIAPNVMQTTSPTCLTDSMESKLSARIWLEVGHACEPRREASGRTAAQEWRVWVRGVAGADIATFVRKVVFQLRPENKFPYPERVFEEPPYLVRQCGVAPSEVLISVFLKHTTQPDRIRLTYGPLLWNAEICMADSRCIYFDVKNPSEQLQTALMKSETASQNSGSILVVLPDSGEVHPHRPTLNTSVHGPLQHKQVLLLKNSSRRSISKRKAEFCTTQSGSVKQKVAKGEKYEFVSPIDPKLWENMKLPSITFLKEGELQQLEEMCSALNLYAKSGQALPLPPLSAPLYRLPELPAELRRALADDEPDYVLQ